MKNFKIFLFFLFSLGTISSAFAQKLEVSLPHIPPYIDFSDLENPKGVLVDVMGKTLKEAKINYSGIGTHPMKRLYAYLSDGTVTCSMGPQNSPSYHKSVIYSKNYVIDIRLYSLSLQGEKKQTKSIKDWKGKVILVRGLSYGGLRARLEKLEKLGQLKIVNAHNHFTALKMLKLKRGDHMLDYVEVVEDSLKEVPIPNIQKTIISSVKIHFIIYKSISNAKEIVAKIDAAFDKLHSKGRFNLENLR